MKKINVRLTDEEHEVLADRAREGRRSLQRQIVFELFHPSPAVRAVLADGSQEFRVLETEPIPNPVTRRPVTGLDKNCRNADYHWKMQPGEVCKFCGGVL